MQFTSIHRLAHIAGSCALTVAAVFVSPPSFAQSTGGPTAAEVKPPGASKPPAKEAIDACAGKSEGDKVTFTDAKNKKRKWVCVPVDGVLAARSGVATPALKPKPQ